MPLNPEFVVDLDSPANGMGAHRLKIMPPRTNSNGRVPKQLMKWHKANDWARYAAIESGLITDLPGIRALRLWNAEDTGHSRSPLTLGAAKQRQTEPIAHFLATPLQSGQLIVSSHLGYRLDTHGVMVPEELQGPHNGEPIAEDPLINDIALTGRDLLRGLVSRHIMRTKYYRLNLHEESDPAFVDLPLANLLTFLPESEH